MWIHWGCRWIGDSSSGGSLWAAFLSSSTAAAKSLVQAENSPRNPLKLELNPDAKTTAISVPNPTGLAPSTSLLKALVMPQCRNSHSTWVPSQGLHHTNQSWGQVSTKMGKAENKRKMHMFYSGKKKKTTMKTSNLYTIISESWDRCGNQASPPGSNTRAPVAVSALHTDTNTASLASALREARNLIFIS